MRNEPILDVKQRKDITKSLLMVPVTKSVQIWTDLNGKNERKHHSDLAHQLWHNTMRISPKAETSDRTPTRTSQKTVINPETC